MSADIVTLATEHNVNAAWLEYSSLLRKIQSDPTLVRDEEHNARVDEAERKWRDLFERWAGVPASHRSLAS